MNRLKMALIALLGGFAVAAVIGGNPGTATGTVAWYGEGYRGKKMANGGRFHPDMMTCATNRWPLGTRLAFTNVANDKTVVVTVTDHGPMLALHRQADLSRSAFATIADLAQGVIECRIRVVKEAA